jgi:nitrite reductase (NO-forming)
LPVGLELPGGHFGKIECFNVGQTEDFKFAQNELHVLAGSEVKLGLLNTNISPHSFDIDELDLHIAMPANDSAETTLTITQPGTYTFYCAIPGHREVGMVGSLIVEP